MNISEQHKATPPPSYPPTPLSPPDPTTIIRSQAITMASSHHISDPDTGPEPTDSGFSTEKRALAIGPTDPLLAAWNDELMQTIMALLSAEHVAWTSVNVIRMGQGTT